VPDYEDNDEDEEDEQDDEEELEDETEDESEEVVDRESSLFEREKKSTKPSGSDSST
jgi:hypothetical protein